MDYMTPQEAAEKWHIGLRRVQFFCANNKIFGVKRVGRQWFIPKDAEKPEDGRTKKAKATLDTTPYHFPGFFYSEYYASKDLLSDDERLLLDAQILAFSNRFPDSAKICKKLIENTNSPSVLFGTYATLALNYIYLGLFVETEYCKNKMLTIMSKTTEHLEDYRLIFAFIAAVHNVDMKPINDIDASKLSRDALIAYESFLSFLSAFNIPDNPEISIKLISALCKNYEYMGIESCHMAAHGALATLYGNIGNTEKQTKHIDELCRIGYESKLNLIATKYSITNPTGYKKSLTKISPSYANEIIKQRKRNAKIWTTSYNIASSKIGIPNITNEELEVILLLITNLSNKKIAELKGLSARKIGNIIKRLCQQFNLSNKNELKKYFIEMWNFNI